MNPLPAVLLICALIPQEPTSRPVHANPVVREIEAIPGTYGFEAAYADLCGFIAADVRGYGKRTRLRDTTALLRAPLDAPRFAFDLTDRLEAAVRAQNLFGLIHEGARLIEAVPMDDPRAGIRPDGDVPQDFAAFKEVFLSVQKEAGHAVSGIADEDLDRTRAELLKMLDRVMLGRETLPGEKVEATGEEDRTDWDIWSRAQMIDWAVLVHAAKRLAVCGDKKWLAALAQELSARVPKSTVERPAGVGGSIVFAEQSPAGWILIGGSGSNRYDCDAALIVDLGGADTYGARATRSDIRRPLNVVIDLGSSGDTYETAEDASIACGLLGISILVDCGGNDRYMGGRATQGAGLGGIGILIDREGDDRFDADGVAQGAAIFGVGLFLDLSGNDVANATWGAQGFAGPTAAGIMIDVAGNDRRAVMGVGGQGEDDVNHVPSLAQGAATGIAGFVPGGFGVYLDLAGDDISTLGDTAYGVGLCLGTGIARDKSGADKISARSAAIGYAEHAGFSVVIDDAGKDERKIDGADSLARSKGGSASFFIDLLGDDVYEFGPLSAAAAADGSLALFRDLAGKDAYRSKGESILGSLTAPAGIAVRGSAALFLESGGSPDLYEVPSVPHAVDGKSARTTGCIFEDR